MAFQLTGRVNGPDQPESATAVPASTLSAGVTLGGLLIPASALTVAGRASFPEATTQFEIKIGTERILITGRSGLNLVVPVGGRGFGGTTAAAHASGANIWVPSTDYTLGRDPRSMTTLGDTEYMGADGAPTRFPAPTDGVYATAWNSGVPSWQAITTATAQNANLVYAGPSTGSAAVPTFRNLVPADIPDLSATYLTPSSSAALTNKTGNISQWTNNANFTTLAAVAGVGYLTSVTAHNLLSAIHGDTTAGSVARGDLITGQGASAKWARLVKGTANQVLAMDGTATDILWVTAAGGGNLSGTLTEGRIPFASGASTLVDSANLTWDGMLLTAVGAFAGGDGVVDALNNVFSVRKVVTVTTTSQPFIVNIVQDPTGTITGTQLPFSANVLFPSTNSQNSSGALYGFSFYYDYSGIGSASAVYASEMLLDVNNNGSINLAYGMNAGVHNYGLGTITTAYGAHLEVNFDSTGLITNGFGVYVESLGASGTIANAYSFWSDEQGVTAIRAINDFDSVYQASLRFYNPLFTKYTAGAANHERAIEYWTANVWTLTTEKGGTGTLRGMTLGASASVPLSVHGVTPIVQPVLATGAAHSVDDVITALQAFGMVRQA